jgi:hypothetical protein
MHDLSLPEELAMWHALSAWPLTVAAGCHRILAGWVPGSERVTLGLADMAAGSSGPVVRRFTLWPYDRPESKGQLKGVALRIEDGKVLVLGYR